jgi:acyl-CoA reductase-like NAD-dependent aldehyde dehydrogenase
MATTAPPSASNYKDATPEQLDEAFRTTREYFRSGATRSYKWRVSQIEAVKRMLIENKDAVSAAVYADLRRPK